MCVTQQVMWIWETFEHFVQCTRYVTALLLIPTLASTTTGSSTTEGYRSFHLSHPFSILPPRLLSFLVFCFGFCVCLVWFVLCLFHFETET